MRPLIHEIDSRHSPESLVEQLRREHGVVLLRSGFFDSGQARFSFIAARPFLTFRSFGSRCELHSRQNSHVQFGNPWHLLDSLMARYELLPILHEASDGFAFETESLLLAARNGFRVEFVPVRTIYRSERSKIKPMRDTFRYVRILAKYRI